MLATMWNTCTHMYIHMYICAYYCSNKVPMYSMWLPSLVSVMIFCVVKLPHTGSPTTIILVILVATIQ